MANDKEEDLEPTKVFFFISENSKNIDLQSFQDALNDKNIKIEKVQWPKGKIKKNGKR